MNGVPEAQSENIKLSDASQGDSELNWFVLESKFYSLLTVNL